MTEILESFVCRNKYDYATFVVLQRFNEPKTGADHVGYFMLAIESSYGNGFAYAWSHPGTDFYDFLCRCDEYYLCSKLCSGEQNPADWEATCSEIKRAICRRRLERDCSADEARAAWPEHSFECETDFSNWNNGQGLISEPWEHIATCLGPRKRDFMALHKEFWAGFCEQLRASQEKRKAV